MLIPYYENYNYDYDFDTNSDIITNLRTGNTIKFQKKKSRGTYNTPTGIRHLISYRACLNGNMVNRALIRGWCITENGFDSSKPFDRQSLIPINGNIEDDRIENLKWVPRIYQMASYILNLEFH